MLKRYILFILLAFPIFLFAQKKSKEKFTFQEVANIKLDGDLGEWGSGLYHEESDVWSFGIATAQNRLFAAVRIKDPQLINEAIRNGVLLNISYSNKKKDGAKLIYPRLNMEKLEGSVEEEFRGDISKDKLIASARGYYISGFSRLVDGLVSFNNQYGIRAICKIDSLGSLVYEAEIPLELIKFQTNEIAVELGINTQYTQMKKVSAARPQSNIMGVYGVRQTNKRSIKNPYEEDTSVWFMGVIR